MKHNSATAERQLHDGEITAHKIIWTNFWFLLNYKNNLDFFLARLILKTRDYASTWFVLLIEATIFFMLKWSRKESTKVNNNNQTSLSWIFCFVFFSFHFSE